MGRPNGYYLADGTKIPGTTTITGRFKDSGGLIHWAFTQGMAQGELKAAGKPFVENTRAIAQEAADKGTVVHGLVEQYIKTGQQPAAIVDSQVKSAFDAFLRWQQGSRLEVKHTEVALVCPVLKVGGTIDAIGMLGDKWCLPDWKSSNGLYVDYLWQIANYGYLAEHGFLCDEQGRQTNKALGIKVESYELCRFSKENADFSHNSFASLANEFETFKILRRAYDLARESQKRLGK